MLRCLDNFLALGHDNLRRVARRRRAHIGRQIRQSYINFVTNANQRRNSTRRNRAHERLVVERAQIISATAATNNHQNFWRLLGLIEIFNRIDNLIRRRFALNLNVRHIDLQSAPTFVQNLHKIRITSRLRATNHADMTRHRRQQAFPLGGEQAFFF